MTERLTSRLAFVGFVMVGLFAAMLLRLWYLQVLSTEELQVEAESNRIEIVITPPTRGRILDRHGVVMAENVRSGVVTVEAPDAARLREVLGNRAERREAYMSFKFADGEDDKAGDN